MRLGLGLAALGLAAVLCLSGAAARDRIESEDRWATAVNTLKRKTRRLQADDDPCPTQLAAWQDCLNGLVADGTITGDDDGLVTGGTITGDDDDDGCEPSNCDEATAYVYKFCSSSQQTGPASACNADYHTYVECEMTSALNDVGLSCDFTGACTSGPYDDDGTCAPTTAAPSAAPTTSPAPTTAAPTTATPSAAPTITRKPTLQPTDKPTWELHASRGWRSGVLDILAKDEMHIAYTSNPMQSSAQCLHGNEMYLPARVLCDRQCMLDGAAVARASGGTRAPPTAEECAGPWYCARTDVCELFRNPEHAPGADAGFDRRCTTIWGCANHSMCFPDEDAAAGMHIDFRKEDLAIKRRSGDRPGHQVCFPASLGCLLDASPSPRRRRRDALPTPRRHRRQRHRRHRRAPHPSSTQARWVSDPMELRYGGFTVRTTCCANDHDFEVGVDMPCNGAARATAFVGFGLLLWGLWT